MNALNWILTGVLALGALSGWVFTIIYTRRTAWWDDEHRTHLALFTLSLTLIMTLYVFRPLFDPVVFAYTRAPLFVAVVACMVWRVTLLIRSDRRRQRLTEVPST
jgi:MFS superfamily sulfate permease-like transporter